jgi:hypothetical protein
VLHTESVSPLLLKTLQAIFSNDKMGHFVLVGGTALSLRIGHRKSIDIDLFTNEKPDFGSLPDDFLAMGIQLQVNSRFAGGLFGFVDGIKADFIRHDYPWVGKVDSIDGIRIASLQDIAAMKLNAIVGNGSRLKDYVDLAFMSSLMSLNEMLDSYEKKYPDINAVMALKSLCYFDDIDHSVQIELLRGKHEWNRVKSRIIDMVDRPYTIFPSFVS